MKLTWRTFKWLAIVGSLPPLYFQLRALVQEEYAIMKSWEEFMFWFMISILVTITLSVIVFKEIEWLLSNFTFDMHCSAYNGELSYLNHLFEELTTGMVLWAILISVTEGVYFFNEWREGLVLSEKLEKEKVESQLEAMRKDVGESRPLKGKLPARIRVPT